MFFKSKKQVEQLKAIPVLEATTELHQTLHLSMLNIIFSVSQTRPYVAYIKYNERPTDWNNHGAETTVELVAESWPELINKVIAHFEGFDY